MKIINCYLYLLNTLADWEIGYITAELNSRRFFADNIGVKLIKISSSLSPITTMGGIDIVPDKTVDDINFKEGDILILPGASTWMKEENREIIGVISDLLSKKVVVAAICGATAALAGAGILNNRKHTSNDKSLLKMICPDYLGEKHYINAPVVVDDNLITATGFASLDFSYEIFKKMKIMKEETLKNWYQLYNTKESKYFYSLIESMQ